jgi:hypothetical protein
VFKRAEAQVDGRVVLSGVVVDISGHGARFGSAAIEALPERFTLVIAEDDFTAECAIANKNRWSAGLRFTASPSRLSWLTPERLAKREALRASGAVEGALRRMAVEGGEPADLPRA